jgi:hypothetical protein
MAQRHGKHRDKPMSVRMPDLLRARLKSKALRDGVTVHALLIRAAGEMLERDEAGHAATSAGSAASSSPSA